MSTRQQIKRESLKKRNEKLTQRANKLKLEKLNNRNDNKTTIWAVITIAKVWWSLSKFM